MAPSPRTEAQHKHDGLTVKDSVDQKVVTDANAQLAVTATQLRKSLGAWISGQGSIARRRRPAISPSSLGCPARSDSGRLTLGKSNIITLLVTEPEPGQRHGGHGSSVQLVQGGGK